MTTMLKRDRLIEAAEAKFYNARRNTLGNSA
jgi:hypothetical protein